MNSSVTKVDTTCDRQALAATVPAERSHGSKGICELPNRAKYGCDMALTCRLGSGYEDADTPQTRMEHNLTRHAAKMGPAV